MHVRRLDNLFSMWEDRWILEAAAQALKLPGRRRFASTEGALVNHLAFRRKLLRSSPLDQSTPFDYRPFLAPPPPSHNSMLDDALAVTVGEWCLSSRRVYRIPIELATVLLATSLEGVRWGDVELPFPAFAISLPDELATSSGTKFDFGVFSKAPSSVGRTGFMLTLVDAVMDGYKPINNFEREKIRGYVQRRRADKLTGFSQSRSGARCPARFGVFNLSGVAPDELLTETISRNTAEGREDIGRAGASGEFVSSCERLCRIVMGLCLYMKALPAGTPHISAWKPHVSPVTRDPTAVTRGAQLCTVESIYRFTPEDIREIQEAMLSEGPATQRELRCHFREGYWHRPRGLGQDPQAEKTEHTRPTIVRRDRLPPGGLPGGSEKSF